MGSFRNVSRLALVQSVVDHIASGCSSTRDFLLSDFCLFPPRPTALFVPLLEAGLFFHALSLEYFLLLLFVVRNALTPLATLRPAPVMKTTRLPSLMKRASSHNEEEPRPLRLLREGGTSWLTPSITLLFLFLLVRRGDVRRSPTAGRLVREGGISLLEGVATLMTVILEGGWD